MLRLSVLVLLLFILLPGWTGELESFEQSIKDGPQYSNAYDDNNNESACSTALSCLFSELFQSIFHEVGHQVVAGAVIGGHNSMFKAGENIDSASQKIRLRKPGDPLVPSIQIETQYQMTTRDVWGTDLRLEGGYGAIGFQFRRLDLQEKTPSDHLNVLQSHLLYRMIFGNHFGMSIGLGQTSIKGDDKQSGYSLAGQFHHYFKRHFGVEWRPVISTINHVYLRDHDIGLVIKRKQFSAKMGYRSLNTPEQTIEGPYLGIAVTW